MDHIEQNSDQKDPFPYRYGSYYIFEANNNTKNFKIATFVNLTSNDAINFYPQHLYSAVIKTASGRNDLKFTVTNVPNPKSKYCPGFEAEANGIFVAWIVGIAYSLIPASIIARIVYEKESGLFHLQKVTGVDMRSYWLSFYVFDIILVYICTLLTWFLVDIFNL